VGYDLYGLRPSDMEVPDCDFSDEDTTSAYFAWQKNTMGAYFRSNVWGWKPLWGYVTGECSDILSSKDAEGGTYNGGHKISKTKAIKIARRISKLNKNGELRGFVRSYKEWSDNLNDEGCAICDGTGTRKGWEGWQSESEWLEHHDTLDEVKYEAECLSIAQVIERGGILKKLCEVQQVSYRWANTCKGCNSCHGKGKKKNFKRSYFLNEADVIEFGEFCRYSGGFVIH